ncbi:MAG: 50S ribosomal protein L29, partial [Metamycoplasmataceae bacterium]
MQYSTIQKKSKQELLDLINELKAELFLLRFKNKTGQQDQTHKIRLVRRDIAKALT